MHAFIQCEKGEPMNPNVFNAYYGLNNLGYECIKFQTQDDLEKLGHQKEDIISGGVGMIRERLLKFGIDVPMIDYPEELKPFLKRDIEKSTINEIAAHPEKWPVFVKSVRQKLMTGRVVRSPKDLIGCGIQGNNYDVYVSKELKMLSEWRVFVRYGEIMDVKLYKGDWTKTYDSTVIKAAVDAYATAPAAYGIDFCVTEDGETVLIEVNDGFALGSYGMHYWDYAKFLITRWSELVDTEDLYR